MTRVFVAIRQKSIMLGIMGVSLLLPTLTLSGLARSQTETPVLSEAEAAVPITLLHRHIQPTGFGGGEADLPTDRLTTEQTEAIQAEIEHNIARLEIGPLTAAGISVAANAQTIVLTWPLSAANGLDDYGYHGISGFVDQDSRYPNFLLDYNCGGRTYDSSYGYNHKGTDFFTWPFPWIKMDNDEVIVIAAAPGIIVNKKDGNFDRSCSISGGAWNAVYVRHSDGSVAWYGHLKNGSLTNKEIGDTVAAGDYLGVVGSSGNSTGPHLHLELHDQYNNLIDPYQGSCNQLNSASWWAEQRPYYDSAVNKVMTGNAPVAFRDCPTPDAPNEQDNFMPGDELFFTTFYRDQLSSQTSHYTIYRPDNSIFQSWSRNSSASHYIASWWWWSFDLPPDAPDGLWRFEVEFNGLIYETLFTVTSPKFISATSPAGGEFWQPGTTYAITWQDNLTADIRIDLVHMGMLSETIAVTATNSGIYTWTVPLSTAVNVGYQVRLTAINDTAVYDASETFAIGNKDQFFFHYLPAIHKE